MSGKHASRIRDLSEGFAHYAEYAPSADGCARRVAFDGWSYILARVRNGHALFYEESWHRGSRVAFARVLADGVIVDVDGLVLGDRGDIRTTIRRAGDSPIKSKATYWPVPCACRGCAPVAVDDGSRPRGTTLQTQESTANVGTPLRRKIQVESRVPPADADAPECAGCGKAVPLAIDQLCWHCLANGYLNGGGM